MSAEPYRTLPGRPHPLGATVRTHGVNFAVFSEHATGVTLLLFNEHDDPDPCQVITLNPRLNKTFHVWHVHVEGLKPGMHYAFRIDGPDDPKMGHRFNPNKVLIDPYGFGSTNNLFRRVDAYLDIKGVSSRENSRAIRRARRLIYGETYA